VVLFLVWLQARGFQALALKPKISPDGKFKAYACGEDVPDHRVQPDYGQFFHFAFFFTLMHVVALVVTTVPAGSLSAAGFAVAFLVCAAIGLSVLFRR
jgi:NADH-quinone oxidoreductase subunit A